METSADEKALHTLVDLFLEENAKHNLSAFRTKDACWVGNVRDSLSLLDALSTMTNFKDRGGTEEKHGKVETVEEKGAGLRILDIGMGGGFPLLPLAIALPNATCVGIDATRKKVDAVERIVDALNLPNVKLLCGRAEDMGHDALQRESYDLVLARAVAPLATLLELTCPFAKVSGHVVVWKSMALEKELSDSLPARTALSCHLIHTHPYTLDEEFGKRQLLIFEKAAPTKDQYPRKPGVPKKRPLK